MRLTALLTGLMLALSVVRPAVADMAVAQQLLQAGDYEAAYQAFLPHARDGNPEAQTEIGLMFLNGDLPQDDETALYWIEQAAELDDPFANYVLGWMHEFGRGVPESPVEAVVLYERAADGGVVSAQRQLGNLFAYGADGIQIDHAAADRWYELAVAEGDPAAMNSYSWSLILRGERYLDALDLAERAVAIAPGEAPSTDTLGTARLVLERYASAAKVLEVAVELEPDYPGFRARLGDAYHGMGNIAEARAAWQEALDLAVDFDGTFDELWDPFAVQDMLDETAVDAD